MVAGGLTEQIGKDKLTTFSFPDPGTIPPPVIMVQKVSFRYSENKVNIFCFPICGECFTDLSDLVLAEHLQ
jgi:hypothetical protein